MSSLWAWEHVCEQNTTRNEVSYETEITRPKLILVGDTTTGHFEHSELISFCPYCGESLLRNEDESNQCRDRSDELAPCPKCGSKHLYYAAGLGGLACTIRCEGCGAIAYRCTIGRGGYATDEAIEAWNDGKVSQ